MSDKQLIEMIAQGQAQRIMQDKQNQQMMAEYDAWKQQQQMASLMSEFDAWKSANNPQPVQTQQVKKVETPKEEQTIPSLADFFTPTTASGKNVNKESANFLQRENYAKERAKENELASPKKEKPTNVQELLTEELNKPEEKQPEQKEEQKKVK